MAPKIDREKNREKKEKILRATTQLLLKKGNYTATSTTDICNAARIARPSLYHYFGSKRNLLFSLHIDHIGKVLTPYMEKASSIEDPLERLTFMVGSYVRDIMCLHPELRFLIHDTLAIKDKYFRGVREEWKKHYLLLRKTIKELQERGQADRSMNASWAALFMLGMMTWISYWFNYDQKEEIDDMASTAVQFVLHGLNIDDQP